MSLVDYGSSDSEDEKMNDKKGEEDNSTNNNTATKKLKTNDASPSITSTANTEAKDGTRKLTTNEVNTKKKAELPPLPEDFDDVGNVSTSSKRITSTLPKNNSNTVAKPTQKKSDSPLMPPQLWKKRGNISIEDTAAWNTERKTPPKPKGVEQKEQLE